MGSLLGSGLAPVSDRDQERVNTLARGERRRDERARSTHAYPAVRPVRRPRRRRARRGPHAGSSGATSVRLPRCTPAPQCDPGRAGGGAVAVRRPLRARIWRCLHWSRSCAAHWASAPSRVAQRSTSDSPRTPSSTSRQRATPSTRPSRWSPPPDGGTPTPARSSRVPSPGASSCAARTPRGSISVRQEMTDICVRAIECNVRICLELKGTELPTAERLARELTQRAPFRESGYCLLMRALAERGQPAEALRVYAGLQGLLSRRTRHGPVGLSPATARAAAARLTPLDHRCPAELAMIPAGRASQREVSPATRRARRERGGAPRGRR